MLSLVWDRRPTYNNNSQITSNFIMTYIKLLYYKIFAIGYGFVGSLTDLVMVNSSWTYGHIRSLWRMANDIFIVYPPCDTKSLEDLPLSTRQNGTNTTASPDSFPPSLSREAIIVSIGQFRPEKDHELQIRSFANFMNRARRENHSIEQYHIKLVLIGSCRGESDEKRVAHLKSLAETLDVSKQVEFVINQPFPVLKKWLGRASIGLHTMWNEHFGIGVVEMMAAGLLTIAHDTGGPKSNIVVPLNGQRTGYLASTEEEYAGAIYRILLDFIGLKQSSG
jgi:alpha-1,2-mannosyltransferase